MTDTTELRRLLAEAEKGQMTAYWRLQKAATAQLPALLDELERLRAALWDLGYASESMTVDQIRHAARLATPSPKSGATT